MATGEGRAHRGRIGFSVKMLIMAAVLVAVYLYSFVIGSVDISVGTVVDILRQYDLPVDCAFRAEDMLPTILHDKKATGDTINLIVPTAVGQCRIVKTPASEIMDWLRAGGAR